MLDDPTGRLVENIPRRMRVGALEKVEVRIARSAVEGLTERMTGGGRLHRHEVRVADAMTVRLRAPDGGFLIDPLSAETCWTHKAKSAGLQEKDFASWRWSVTPQRRGRARLLLIISAQTLDANGMAAEAALPDQIIKVKVRVNYGRTIRKAVGWGLLMVAGGALNAWGRELYPAARHVTDRGGVPAVGSAGAGADAQARLGHQRAAGAHNLPNPGGLSSLSYTPYIFERVTQ